MKRDNLLIVAASSVVISAFLIILTISQQQTIESLTTELVAQSPLPDEVYPSKTPDPFTDWQTYTNMDYGFEFKYPPIPAIQPIVSVDLTTPRVVESPKEMGDFYTQIIWKKEYIVDGIQGSIEEGIYHPSGRSLHFVLPVNDATIKIQYYTNNPDIPVPQNVIDDFTQILSTFKFINDE